MHSVTTRVNIVFSFAFTCLAAATFGCFLTTFLTTPPVPTIQLQVVDDPVVKDQRQYHFNVKKSDRADFKFHLNADFTPLFNWNTKQLFVYVVAEYTHEQTPFNQVVIWDKIIQRDDGNEKLALQKLKIKYPFFDDRGALLGNNVTLSLHWNVIPVAGTLPRYADGSIALQLPSDYTKRN
eukprot:m.142803 g.142803  ORF g.142803 m.142803 type:complete len:180 (+) comp14070_c2_seq2:87-626(+)